MKKNEFLRLSSSPLMNLDHTFRYSGTRLVEQESLSQHIVDTIMMGILIIDKINSIEDNPLDLSIYIMKATYHDLEEVITGDVPRPLKYFNEDTHHSLKSVADSVAKNLFDSQTYHPDLHYNIWDEAKEGREGFILKIVDTLCVANKVVKEVSLLNNFYMLRVAHEVSHYIDELRETLVSHDENFSDSAIRYLSELLKSAAEAMEDILQSHKDVLSKNNIVAQSMI